MSPGRISWFVFLIPTVSILVAGCQDNQSGSAAYLDLIKKGIAQTRSNLPSITDLAEQASKLLLAGGKIWVCGSQGGFYGEAVGRAGGLMSIQPMGQGITHEGDIILYGVPGTLSRQDLDKIKAWKSQGIYVVVFASENGASEEASADYCLIENLNRDGLTVKVNGEQKLIPVDTVMNVINLWVWTGEMTAACTRGGKMPVHYMSHGLPGGRERGKKYEGQTFHGDFQIAPIKSGLLGAAYLNVIEKAVDSLRSEQIADLHRAGQWWKASKKENVCVLHIGHLFPAHIQDPRSPQRFNQVFSNIGHTGIELEPDKQMLVLGLSYQLAPEPVIAQAKTSGMKFVYNSVNPGNPPEPAGNIIYIKAGWPLPDACVKVPGYDVDILPASGAINAIIYWSILADSCELDSVN